MSGIAGIINLDGNQVEAGLIESMTTSMKHRGPDGIHHWSSGPAALGLCLMQTTPESLQEKQPLRSEDESLVLVMDGRVDNWEDLRRELLGLGARLRSRADSELVLRAFQQWGESCPAHIDGDFAFVIWDEKNRKAFAGRDRMGNKPFYYAWDGQSFVFASELQAILALPMVAEIPNEGMLAEYLSLEWYSLDETFWQGVMRLLPAHTMSLSGNTPYLNRYWQPDYDNISHASEAELAEEYKAIFIEQVRRQSRTQNMLACEVSGGLDSSAVFAVAEKLRLDGALSTPELNGYGLAFPDDPDANEIEYIRSMSRHLKKQVREVPPSVMPFSWYQEAAKQSKQFPGYPNGEMAVDLRKLARREGARVLLSGVGGDEWLGMPRPGPYYAEEMALGHWQTVYECFLCDQRTLGTRTTLWWMLRFGLVPLLPEPIKVVRRKTQKLVRSDKRNYLSASLESLLSPRRKAFLSRERPSMPRRGQIQLYDVLYEPYSGHARESEEHMTARLGLEIRSPFHSHHVIEWAFKTPERFRVQGRTAKGIHRLAMKDFLPTLVLKRTSKADFMGQFRAELSGIDDTRVQEVLYRRRRWLNTSRMLSMFQKDVGREWLQWSLLGSDATLP